MKLQDQCCSLELAKQLKELGIKQELFDGDSYWVKSTYSGKFKIYCWPGDSEDKPYDNMVWYKAFGVAELGEMLPDKVFFQDKYYFFGTTWKRKCGEYGFKYKNNEKIDYLPAKIGKTEADARAKMIVYLLENKLINN